MSLAFTEHDVAVWQGDAREQLALMPAGSVQCAVTSPPYFGLRDYGVDGQLGLESSPAEYVARMVAVFAEVRRVLAADGVLWLNLGDSYNSGGNGYTQGGRGETAKLGGAGKRNLQGRIGTSAVAAKNLLGMPWRTAFALQDDGWILRNAVVWHKPNAMPESVTDRLSTRYELVFLFSRSRRYWFDLDPIREAYSPNTESFNAMKARFTEARTSDVQDARTGRVLGRASDPNGGLYRNGGATTNALGRNPGDVWTITTSPFPGAHFACMPPALAERCIKAGCPPGGTVLDPFAGSGTTLAAARKLGRKSVGIELNPDYIDLIRDRIGQAPLEFEPAPVAVEPCVVQDGFDLGDGWPA